MTQPVILGSASTVRHQLLINAGVVHTVSSSRVDEDEIKLTCRNTGETVQATARALAVAKARTVSRKFGGALVIGADQILTCDGAWFDKPASEAAVHEHLVALQGKTHHLVNATAIVENDVVVWEHGDTIEMVMRPLSPAFIADYLELVGDQARQSVGGYFLEGLGAQLFDRVEGDFFNILGLPLLPLLAYLRVRNVLLS